MNPMNLNRLFAVASLPLFAATVADAHIHMTVDTFAGAARIAAGYLPAESGYTVSSEGVLLLDGAPAEFDLEFTLDAPHEFEGWVASDPIVLTSDFFLATGRLNGGDFNFEIAAVTPVDGEHHAVAAWGFGEHGPFEAHAISSGATRAERSFNVGIGSHAHGQILALSHAGEYDITLVAWDANGVYADSAPVTFRVHAVPACPGDADGDGGVGLGDIALLITHWSQAVPPAPHEADLDHDKVIGLGDVAEIIAHWGQACP